ncbi:hypothetical protein [Specibacter cremeus]|uniref:hypothetical protein n=1 Tax=Specibacter cremeus TaxID=1629051 RepID=UPI000F7AD10F|nr:hypothetical protein [Specibacter cremeus]
MSMSGMPSYNPGEGRFDAGPRPTVPSTVQRAYWLVLAAALFHLISGIFNLIHVSSAEVLRQIENQLKGQNVPAGSAEAAQTFSIVTVSLITVFGLVLYILIALFLRKGMNWARITGSVLAVISLYQLVGVGFPAGIFTIVQVVLGIAGMVLCYLAPSTRYFAEAKAFRRANRLR